MRHPFLGDTRICGRGRPGAANGALDAHALGWRGSVIPAGVHAAGLACRPDQPGTARMDRLRARVGIACGVLAFITACFMSLSGDWSGLFSRDAARRMLELFTSFFPPESDPAFLRKAAYATLETLAISWMGTLLAVMAGLFSALPAAGLWGAVSKGIARMLLNALRAVPELVWAALLVIAAGLGPFPGTLALAAHPTGVLGR